jgi:hypothetical protein
VVGHSPQPKLLLDTRTPCRTAFHLDKNDVEEVAALETFTCRLAGVFPNRKYVDDAPPFSLVFPRNETKRHRFAAGGNPFALEIAALGYLVGTALNLFGAPVRLTLFPCGVELRLPTLLEFFEFLPLLKLTILTRVARASGRTFT